MQRILDAIETQDSILIDEAIQQSSELDVMALKHALLSSKAPWRCESLRTKIDALNLSIYPIIRAIQQRLGCSRAETFDTKQVQEHLENEFADAPWPVIDLVKDVWTQPTNRCMVMYNSQEYVDIVRASVAKLSDTQVLTMYYLRFSPAWNPMASSWLEEISRGRKGPNGRRAETIFAIHFYALQERVVSLKTNTLATFKSICAEIRPLVDAEIKQIRTSRTPEKPKWFV